MAKIKNILIYSEVILSESLICFICCFFTFPFYFGILIFLLLNFAFIFLARLLIQYYTFQGQTYLHSTLTLFDKGKAIAVDLSCELNKIISELKILIGIDRSIYNEYWNNFDDLLLYLDKAIKIMTTITKSYELIRDKGKRLSSKQIAFEKQINVFMDLLIKSQLKLFIGIKVSINQNSNYHFNNSNKNMSNGVNGCNSHSIMTNNLYNIIMNKIHSVINNDNHLQELAQFYNFNFMKSISQVILAAEILMHQLSIYENKNWSQMPFDDFLGSFELLKSSFDNRFKGKYSKHTLVLSILSSIEFVIVKGDKAKGDSRTLMIISGMNMTYYEDLSEFNQFNLYLKQGIDLLYWNYPGYSYSKGITTINSIKRDIVALFDEVKLMGQWDHFGAHGMSIGSLPSCHLAAHRDIDLLVIDRGFSSINKFIQNWNLEPIEFFYELFLMPSSDNVINYLNAKCNKIILCSINDMIINETCNIKTGISNHIIKTSIRLRRTFNNERQLSVFPMVSSNELKENLLISNDTTNKTQSVYGNGDDKNNEYYSLNDEVNDLLDVMIDKNDQVILTDALVLFIDVINKVIRAEINSTKSSKNDFNIPQDILWLISSKEAFLLIDDFILSFHDCNSSLKTLSIDKTYRRNRETVGAFFSNLFIWYLNKDKFKQKYTNEIVSIAYI